jgi:ABC-type Fe3+ transport system permease subunit
MLPGVVLALGLLWVYVGGIPLPIELYGTIWLIAICCNTKRMPLGVRTD